MAGQFALRLEAMLMEDERGREVVRRRREREASNAVSGLLRGHYEKRGLVIPPPPSNPFEIGMRRRPLPAALQNPFEVGELRKHGNHAIGRRSSLIPIELDVAQAQERELQARKAAEQAAAARETAECEAALVASAASAARDLEHAANSAAEQAAAELRARETAVRIAQQREVAIEEAMKQQIVSEAAERLAAERRLRVKEEEQALQEAKEAAETAAAKAEAARTAESAAVSRAAEEALAAENARRDAECAQEAVGEARQLEEVTWQESARAQAEALAAAAAAAHASAVEEMKRVAQAKRLRADHIAEALRATSGVASSDAHGSRAQEAKDEARPAISRPSEDIGEAVRATTAAARSQDAAMEFAARLLVDAEDKVAAEASNATDPTTGYAEQLRNGNEETTTKADAGTNIEGSAKVQEASDVISDQDRADSARDPSPSPSPSPSLMRADHVASPMNAWLAPSPTLNPVVNPTWPSHSLAPELVPAPTVSLPAALAPAALAPASASPSTAVSAASPVASPHATALAAFARAPAPVSSTSNREEGSASSVSATLSMPFAFSEVLATQLSVSDVNLGEGGSGSVWKGELAVTPSDEGVAGGQAREVAVKIVEKAGLDDDELRWVREEVSIHEALQHPCIVRLHGAIETESRLTLVLDLCRGGTFTDVMVRCVENDARLPEAQARSYFLQLLAAVRYCHTCGVAHRDLKLDNLCWRDTQERALALIDFGYATREATMSGFAGTAHYAAPEVHRQGEASGKDGGPFVDGGGATGEANKERASSSSYACAAADVWSLGVILFAMLSSALPFGGDEETDKEAAELKRKIESGVWDSEPGCSAEARQLLEQMLRVDPDKRLALEQVVAHSWVGGEAALKEAERAAEADALPLADTAVIDAPNFAEPSSAGAPQSTPTVAPAVIKMPKPPRPPPGEPRDLDESEYTDHGYSDCSDYEDAMLAYEERMIEASMKAVEEEEQQLLRSI